MQVTKLLSKKITRTRKTGNLSLLSIESSTTPTIKMSTHDNKSSGIADRVSIASSNEKVQCYLFNSIHSRDHTLSSTFTSHDLNSLIKKLLCTNSEEIKKITRPNNTSSLFIANSLSTKKTIR